MVVVVVDERERKTRVPELLAGREGVAVTVRRLKWGDYAVGRALGIERKTADDFARSVVDGRLFRQMAAIRRWYARPLLLVEGLVSGREMMGVPWHALRGALVSVVAVFRVPILHSSGAEESADLIHAAALQLQRSFSDGYARPGYRPKGWRKRALYLLQGFPRVGPARAAALLEAFGSVRSVITAEKGALMSVRGIGSGVAGGIQAAAGEAPAPDKRATVQSGPEMRQALPAKEGECETWRG